MDKGYFLYELRNALSFMPKEELEKTIAYYSESISDRMDEGMSEEEAIAALGSIEEIVDSIKKEGNYTKSEKAEQDKVTNTATKVMLYIGAVALGFTIFGLVVTAISIVMAILGFIAAGILTVSTIEAPLMILFFGVAIILTSLFLVCIPLIGYCRHGIKQLLQMARR